MGELVIYHNPRCSKSRQTLSLIEKRGIEPEVVKYLKNPPSVEKLEQILSLLDMEPQDLIRKNEKIYKVNFKNKDFTREEWVRILHNYPKLMERPIVTNGKHAVIGRPPENVNDLLDVLSEEE